MSRESRIVCAHLWACLWSWAGGALGSLLPLDAERLRAGVGGYAVMNCHLDFPFGNEIPYHLQWDKDEDRILWWYSASGETENVSDRWGGRVRRVSGAARLGLGRGSINVSAVRETDAGLYRCRVTFPNRTPPARNNGTFYYLEVDGGNLIATPPINVTVLEGTRAELECLPKSRESSVHWLRDSTPLSSEQAARADLPANGSLVIRSAVSGDLGEYSCQVRDPDGRKQSAQAFLDVQYAAKVVYAPKERNLPLGKPASLDCHFSANPPLTNLRWEKDGFLFDPYNVPGVFYSRNGSLLFNKVDESHEGQYSCTPYNALGTGGASPRVRVRVLRPPALAARPLPLYVARLGATLTLPCALRPADRDTEAAPQLLWTRKDGGSLPAGRHSVDAGSLTIVDVASSDRGVYSCSASNEADTVSADTELLVENVPPRAPRDLVAAPAATAVHVSWQPGESGLEMDYIVWYRERAASEWRTMKILSRGVTEATVGGLRPGAEYELRVLSQDAIGDGLFSKPIFVRTHGPEGEATSETDAVASEPSPAVELAYAAPGAGDAAPGAGAGEMPLDELQVSVRLLEEGALVRWERAPGDADRCDVHWYRGDRLLHVAHTFQDHLLVTDAAEGERHGARVVCVRGAGAAWVQVPAYSRLRAVAGGAAGAALLLATLAGALYAARRRLRPRAPPAPCKYGR